jgi:RNA polymerase primary sigma factor
MNINYKQLTEVELTTLYQKSNDNKIMEYLLQKYEKFILKFANYYYWKTNLENEDILAYAKIGFMEGVKRYDVSRPSHFMYFCGIWMKMQIMLALDNYNFTVKYPKNKLKEYKKINTALNSLNDMFYSIEELALLTNLDYYTVAKQVGYSTKQISLTQEFMDFAVSHEELSTDAIFMKKSLQKDLEKILEDFTENEKFILIYHYGLFDNIKMDNETIGEHLNISSERVRQIKDRCIRKLRHSSFSSILIQYLN